MKKEKPAKENKKTDSYTVTEVGTLIESFRHEVSIVAGEVHGLSNRMERVETRLTGVEERLTGVEDAVRLAVPDMSKRLFRLEAKVGS